jgi:hypothetical protein
MIERQHIDGAAPTLVFLHEGLGSLGLWRDFPAKIAAATGNGALVYSRYGNGFSRKPASWRVWPARIRF